jgi:glycogen operon protein
MRMDGSCPLGATWDGAGVRFGIFSQHATQVWLCLFDSPASPREEQRLPLERLPSGHWCLHVAGLQPGQLYGFRLAGPFEPHHGHYFNPHKLALDPYARAVSGRLSWHPQLETARRSGGGVTADSTDSAPVLPRCVVVDPVFDWGDDRPPRHPWEETVLYECHVKGLTRRHPQVAPNLRGTYLGLGSPAVLDHLLRLGVTAVELLPLQQFIDERHLIENGLSNYWGYSPVCYFAPEARYAAAAGRQVTEFKSMVRALHHAGIEVILDVVYNHTGEGPLHGPTVCLRGIDNRVYYRADPEDAGLYWDCTGCGNSLNTAHPQVEQLILDSLRYWVTEMRVDGFRFDLAPALARRPYAVDARGRLWQQIRDDPVLHGVKLIAEPWDLGPEGYQTGRFPRGWAEWNDRYRDNLRQFWAGADGQVAELAARFSGSEDIFGQRGPQGAAASINFVTCHDGFTLRDLVSHAHKDNQANGENNADGPDRNYSRNWGHEGPTPDPAINAVRGRMQRNFLASLAVSAGVPMITAGDELGRTQRGNNNAYCQDNDMSWLDWNLLPPQGELLEFTREVLALRRSLRALRRGTFYRGTPVAPGGLKDVAWLREDGREMELSDWQDRSRRALGMLVCAAGPPARPASRKAPAEAPEVLLVLLSAADRSVVFKLPVEGLAVAGHWRRLLSTAQDHPELVPGGGAVELSAGSMQLLAFETKRGGTP